MRVDTILHSYTFRDYPLEDAFRAAADLGWDGLELQPVHFDASFLEQELPRCLKIGEPFDVPIVCVDFSANFISDDWRTIEESVHMMETNIAICAQHGIRLMNGHTGVLAENPEDFGKNGSALAEETHYERAAEALSHLGGLAGRHGVRLTLEIHMNTIHDTIEATAKLLDRVASDYVLANPDPGNMFSTSTAEKDPDALDRLEGRIGYFHFKNCIETKGSYSYSVRLADGHIDTFKYVRKLSELGYEGPVCIEYCGAGDPYVAVEQDIAYFRRCVERANGTV